MAANLVCGRGRRAVGCAEPISIPPSGDEVSAALRRRNRWAMTYTAQHSSSSSTRPLTQEIVARTVALESVLRFGPGSFGIAGEAVGKRKGGGSNIDGCEGGGGGGGKEANAGDKSGPLTCDGEADNAGCGGTLGARMQVTGPRPVSSQSLAVRLVLRHRP